MLLLGIGHRARQGKDTIGQAIYNYYNRYPQVHTELFSFAGPLYEECRTVYGMIGKDAPLLQRVGAERRAEDPNYWINTCFDDIMDVAPEIAVITDVRYRNEADYVKARGGYLINVSRVNEDGTPFVSNDRPADHPSEIELANYQGWDFYLKAKSGDDKLLGDLAITLIEYVRNL